MRRQLDQAVYSSIYHNTHSACKASPSKTARSICSQARSLRAVIAKAPICRYLERVVSKYFLFNLALSLNTIFILSSTDPDGVTRWTKQRLLLSYPPKQFGLVSFPSRIERTIIKLERCLATFPSMRSRAASFFIATVKLIKSLHFPSQLIETKNPCVCTFKLTVKKTLFISKVICRGS